MGGYSYGTTCIHNAMGKFDLSSRRILKRHSVICGRKMGIRSASSMPDRGEGRHRRCSSCRDSFANFEDTNTTIIITTTTTTTVAAVLRSGTCFFKS